MNRDGTNRTTLARNAGTGSESNQNSDWSPNGQMVVFNQATENNTASWLMAVAYSPEGNLAVRIPNSDFLSEPSVSPDSLWVAATGWPTGQRDIYILSISGLDVTMVTNDPFLDFDPAWRPPGK
jgi:Tol biopolymer transport system component